MDADPATIASLDSSLSGPPGQVNHSKHWNKKTGATPSSSFPARPEPQGGSGRDGLPGPCRPGDPKGLPCHHLIRTRGRGGIQPGAYVQAPVAVGNGERPDPEFQAKRQRRPGGRRRGQSNAFKMKHLHESDRFSVRRRPALGPGFQGRWRAPGECPFPHSPPAVTMKAWKIWRSPRTLPFRLMS